MVRTGLTWDPIRPQEVLDQLASPADGAVVLFLGVVRDHNEGRAVTGLTYEAYPGMAERTLAEIAREAGDRFGTDRLTVIHRVGELKVGEVSTAIAVATPHREHAYNASRYIIEEIKARLPMWKKEAYLEGDGHWVPGHTPGVEGGGRAAGHRAREEDRE